MAIGLTIRRRRRLPVLGLGDVFDTDDKPPLRVVDADGVPVPDTSKPGDLRPGENPDETRQPPVPLPSTNAAGNLYGAFRKSQGPNGTWHWGVDLRRDPDDDVVSPERAVVEAVWNDNATAPFVGYGPGGVLLRGSSGIYHLLGHLDPGAWSASSRPTKGQVFEKGQFIGHTAPTGSPGVFQAAPHVHWEVRVKPIDSPATRQNNTLDPLKWLGGVRASRTLREVSSGGGGGLLLLLLLLAISRRR